MKTLFLFAFFLIAVNLLYGQMDLSPYAGNWKMTPANPSHAFSGINIVNNGSTVTIKLKKSPLKTFSARINPETNRLETYMNQIGYYMVKTSNNNISLYEIISNNKVGDYIK